VTDYIAGFCLISGAVLALCAAIGMVRLPDLFSRMHAATKPQTLGLFLIMIGAALRIHTAAAAGMLLVAALLQLLTAPVSSHMVGRAAYRAGLVPAERLAVDELSIDLACGEGPSQDDD